MSKRLFDFTAALAGLMLLAPLFVLVALWIELDSPGPVFFRQQRVGRHGKPFSIYKFRTMTAAPTETLQLTVGRDRRVTHAGQFLRHDWAAILYRDESAILGRAADRERAYRETILPAKLDYYVRYVRERSFWTDLRIIFSTLVAIVH